MRRGRYRKELDIEAIKEYRKTHTNKETAKHFGVAYSTIDRHLKEAFSDEVRGSDSDYDTGPLYVWDNISRRIVRYISAEGHPEIGTLRLVDPGNEDTYYVHEGDSILIGVLSKWI
jgi:hypothetical protein